MPRRFRCPHCNTDADEEGQLIKHVKDNHRNEELMVLVLQSTDAEGERYRKRRFVKRTVLDGSCLKGLPMEQSLPARDETQPDPPIQSDAHKELVAMLPQVVEGLRQNGRLQAFVNFCKLVVAGQRSILNGIAALLFWDVVNFYSCGSIFAMRFSTTTKRFWAVGKKLFHGRFTRFMGGFKGKGLKKDGMNSSELSPEKTQINFVVPDKDVLKSEVDKASISCQKPGIILSNIEAFAKYNKPSNSKNYKICIDGKKIAPGFGKHLGDVDLFGHEESPSLDSRKQRLENELLEAETLLDSFRRAEERNLETLTELSDDEKTSIREKCRSNLYNLALRTRELRQWRLKRSRFVENLILKAGNVWQTSKYKEVISKIKVELHRIGNCIDDGLFCSKQLMTLSSDCADNQVFETRTVDLDHLSKYVCLKELPADSGLVLPSELTKQRTESWTECRSKARVTGSTMFAALGLRTKKEMLEHYDKVFTGHRKSFDGNQQRNFEYGIAHEVDAMATFVSRLLPALESEDTYFHEEGFHRIPCAGNEDFIIVSPDGSIRDRSGDIVAAVEFKCPIPGKKYSTDVQYAIPVYYALQCLSEMAALQCQKLYFVSWTPSSTTVIEASFDSELWNRTVSHLTDMYRDGVKKPSKLPEFRNSFIADLKRYVKEKSKLLAETPSVSVNRLCRHVGSPTEDEDRRGRHNVIPREQHTVKTVDYGNQAAMKMKDVFRDMYNVLRLPAKEVVVALISDLDRIQVAEQCHALPIAYGLSGYSFKTESMRCIVSKLVTVCEENDLPVSVVSTDGQFLTLAIRDKKNRPLTILQVMKDTWSKIRKISKVDSISSLMKVNYIDSKSQIDNQLDYVKDPDTGVIVVRGLLQKPWIVLYTPPKLGTLNAGIRAAGQDRPTVDESLVHFRSLTNQDEGKLKTIVENFKNMETKRKSKVHTVEELKLILTSKASEMDKKLSRDEMLLCCKILLSTQNVKKSTTKAVLTNTLSAAFSDGSTIERTRKKTPPKLRIILKNFFSMKFSKLAVSACLATHVFLDEDLPRWRDEAPFKDCGVGQTGEKLVWYSQPEMSTKGVLYYILDTHHLFVNARSYVTQHGLKSLGVKVDAWLKVAEHVDEKKRLGQKETCELSVPIIKYVLDKQSNAMAREVFSARVEELMYDLGHPKEAMFCSTIRQWYEAEDEPGISVAERHCARMRMRRLLLGTVKLGSFPPPGAKPGGMPASMFEGILTSIDRRTQLYATTPTNAYNVRAPTSLDAENFFGEFQDLDPKGSGVLLADDVPRAIESASYILQMRMDSDREFYMHTSNKERVYPVNPLLEREEGHAIEERNDGQAPKLPIPGSPILMRDHPFDKQRKRSSTKRKRVAVADYNEPSLGTRSVRNMHHAIDHTRILPHERFGLNLE